MCAIARGLMGKPRLLMVHKLSLGLAPRLVKQIAESGLTILLVQQQINRAMQVASYAFVLENGPTVLSGETSELVQREHIKKGYLVNQGFGARAGKEFLGVHHQAQGKSFGGDPKTS